MGCINSKPPGERTLDSVYRVDPECLGQGQYAKVFKATEKKTGKEVAIKKIDIEHSREENLETEIAILQKFGHHKHIIELYDVFRTEKELQLAMELLKGGELFDALIENGPYTELDAANHVRAVGAALHYLHTSHVVHRDLKPENLLLSDKGNRGVLKIADFGLSKIVKEDELMKTACGTWAYCAPEVLKLRQTGTGGYDSKCDMFSVGVILFIILAGYHPFDPEGNNSDKKMQQLILSNTWDFEDPAWDEVSEKAKDLITKLMEPNPQERMSAHEVLTHPWVQGKALRGHLSQTIDKDLGVFKENMRKKLKVGIRAVDAAMAFKREGSARGSAMAAAAKASTGSTGSKLSLAAAAAATQAGSTTDPDGVALASIKVDGTEEAL